MPRVKLFSEAGWFFGGVYPRVVEADEVDGCHAFVKGALLGPLADPGDTCRYQYALGTECEVLEPWYLTPSTKQRVLDFLHEIRDELPDCGVAADKADGVLGLLELES